MAYAGLSSSISSSLRENGMPEVPVIGDSEPLLEVVRKLSKYGILLGRLFRLAI